MAYPENQIIDLKLGPRVHHQVYMYVPLGGKGVVN